MPTDDPSTSEPFNLDQVRALIEMMEKHGLTEISLRHGEEQWRLRRGPQDVVQMIPSTLASAPAPAPVAGPASASADAATAPVDDSVVITSPTVGTFYSAPTPDDPPFVQVGSTVQPDTIVCIVEAMKVFNQIPAEVSGTIAEVLVNNGDSVEFGQPLYRLR